MNSFDMIWYGFAERGSCGAEGRPAFKQIVACKIGVSSLQSEPRSNYMANLGVYYFCVNGNKALSLTGARTPPTWQRERDRREGGEGGKEKRRTWLKWETYNMVMKDKHAFRWRSSGNVKVSKDAAQRDIGPDISLTLKTAREAHM